MNKNELQHRSNGYNPHPGGPVKDHCYYAKNSMYFNDYLRFFFLQNLFTLSTN
jgi:hypothetical protein